MWEIRETADPAATQVTSVLNIGGGYDDWVLLPFSEHPSWFEGAWHHVAFTYDGTTFTNYLDGAMDNAVAQSGAMTETSAPLAIGANAPWYDSFFRGKVDDVRIYRRALTADEIAAIASTGGSAPTIVGGPTATPAVLNLPQHVVLSVSAVDPDGGELTYYWSMCEGPAPVVIAPNATPASSSCTAQFACAGTYVFDVVVIDPSGRSATGTVSVEVNAAPTLDSQPWADPPLITLPEVATLGVTATDADGDHLTYTWSKVRGPGSVTFSTNGTAESYQTVATFDATGYYHCKVTITDDRGGVESGYVGISVNGAPSAVATTPNLFVMPGQTVVLDGTASDDPDDSPNILLSYNWQQDAANPATVAFDHGAHQPQATFTPVTEGRYVFNLTVSDGGSSDTDSVDVIVGNRLTLSSVGSCTEGDGRLSCTLTASHEIPDGQELHVQLSGDDDSELFVPAEVVIQGGHSSVAFDITVVDDEEDDDVQSATLTAGAQYWVDASTQVTIADNEEPTVLVDSHDWGPVTAGTSKTETIVIQNTGTAVLLISEVVVEDDAAGRFVISRQPEMQVAAGGSTSFDVTFTPAALEAYSATLVIRSNDLAGDASANLHGVGHKEKKLDVVDGCASGGTGSGPLGPVFFLIMALMWLRTRFPRFCDNRS